MKKRQGFVSNSSSSSFIAVGIWNKDIKFPDTWTEEEKEDFYDNASGYGENGYFGHQICYGVEDEAPDDLELSKLQEYKEKVEKGLTEKGLTFDPKDIRLLYGNSER